MSYEWELAAEVVVTEEDVLADLEPGALESRPDPSDAVSDLR